MLSCAACLSVRGVGFAFLCFPKNTQHTDGAKFRMFRRREPIHEACMPGKTKPRRKAGQIPARLPLCMPGDLPGPIHCRLRGCR
ncbi:hypothetical protein LZ31DRAFT_550535 [Colletotrichum somersetense]|nr:hypothetical protein LZ31DRAFT_550535 [Colletotrichum somersetense]